MINLLWSGLLMVLMLSGCGRDGAPTRHNDFVPLTSIVIVADSPAIDTSRTIAAHTSTKLKVNGNFSGLFTRDITDQVVWSSDSPTVAEFITASSTNRVTGHIPGIANLTATVGTVSAAFKLTVSSATITAVSITPVAPTIAKGLSQQFTATGVFSDNSTQDLAFDAAWSSSDTNVATVSDAAGSKGLAQAIAAGTATISATFDGVTGTTPLTVTEPLLQSITVSPANPTLLTLSSASFKATGNYSDGTTPDITSQVAWSSSQPTVATIDAASGAAKSLTQGTTSISATLPGVPGVSGTSTLKVTGGNLTGITMSAANITLVKGTVGRITATGAFSNGTSRDISGAVVWSVANTNFATVLPPSGNLVFLNALAVTPTTTVTATSGSLTNTTNLTVTAPLLLSPLAISPASLDMTAGTSGRLTLTANFNDGTSQDVTTSADWSSNSVAIASVGTAGLAKGKVGGIAAGTTTISATYGGQTITAPVTVRTRTIQSLAIAGTTTVASGNRVNFTATASYTDLTSKVVTEDTTWTIDKTNVAIQADSLNQPGQVVGVDSGTATLTATFGGKTQTATITVQ